MCSVSDRPSGWRRKASSRPQRSLEFIVPLGLCMPARLASARSALISDFGFRLRSRRFFPNPRRCGERAMAEPVYDQNRRAWSDRARRRGWYVDTARDTDFAAPLAVVDPCGWLGGEV